jgi:flagellar motor component MotA
MSDINGLLKGTDGKLSLRRILAAILIVWGGVLETIGQTQAGDLLARIAPGAVLIVAGAIILGIITMQNVQELAKVAKGEK